MFSLIDVAPDGNEKFLDLLTEYGLDFNQDEINMIKYGHLPARFDNYIPKVNPREQQKFSELMTEEQFKMGVSYRTKAGKLKMDMIPSGTFKRPEKIHFEFDGKRKYSFSKDDSIMNLFRLALEGILNDFNSGKTILKKHKEPNLYKLLAPLFEFLKLLTSQKQIRVSNNKLLQFMYDTMAIAFPDDFNPEPLFDLNDDKNRYKVSRIKRIITLR